MPLQIQSRAGNPSPYNRTALAVTGVFCSYGIRGRFGGNRWHGICKQYRIWHLELTSKYESSLPFITKLGMEWFPCSDLWLCWFWLWLWLQSAWEVFPRLCCGALRLARCTPRCTIATNATLGCDELDGRALMRKIHRRTSLKFCDIQTLYQKYFPPCPTTMLTYHGLYLRDRATHIRTKHSHRSGAKNTLPSCACRTFFPISSE